MERVDTDSVTSSLSRISELNHISDLNCSHMKPLMKGFMSDSFICVKRAKVRTEYLTEPICFFNQNEGIVSRYFQGVCDADPVMSFLSDRSHLTYNVARLSDVRGNNTVSRKFTRFLDAARVSKMLVMGLNIGQGGGDSVTIAFHRQAGRDDFIDDERRLAERIAPILRQIIRALWATSEATPALHAARALLHHTQDRPLVIVDKQLNVVEASPAAERSPHWAAITAKSERLAEIVAGEAAEAGDAGAASWRIGSPGGGEEMVIIGRRIDPNGEFTLLDLGVAPARGGEAVARLLTPRQREIAEMVSRGCRNWQVAQVLGLSENTVVNHLSAIYDRLGVGSRTELSARWHTLGGEP